MNHCPEERRIVLPDAPVLLNCEPYPILVSRKVGGSHCSDRASFLLEDDLRFKMSTIRCVLGELG